MSERKTYYIKKEDCRDLGWAYEIDGKEYDGNLIINVDKQIIIKGYQIVIGYQVVKGDQIVEGDQIVKGYQRVEGYQIVKGYQRVREKCLIGHCKWIVKYNKKDIFIGCKSKTIAEWDEWFASDEVYETSRDSLAFNQIYKTYLMAKVAQEHDQGLERGE